MYKRQEYIVCIDADTKLQKDAVSYLIAKFLTAKPEENLGAVAGNVKVGNRINWLTKWQSIEYITSQNFDRLAYANINAITAVSYTHLDVYKRQIIRLISIFHIKTIKIIFIMYILRMLQLFLIQCVLHQNIPVSYTHLDVYKRQVLHQMKVLF